MTDPRPPRLRLGVLDYLGWRFPIFDDAGSQRRIDSTAMWVGRTRHGAKLREALRRPRQMFLPSAGFGIVAIVASALLMTPIRVAINSTAWPPIVKMVVLAAVFLGPPIALMVVIASQFRRRSGEYITLMKARALCPVCIYSLEGMDVPSEGMITCPECGAKWRMDVVPKSAPGGVV